MGFDILPQCRNDYRTGLRMHAQKAGQSWIQFELQRLVIQKQQNRTTHVFISRTFNLQRPRVTRRRLPTFVGIYLKSVSFLSTQSAMPFDQMIIRTIQLLIQLDNERLEKRGELPFNLVRIVS